MRIMSPSLILDIMTSQDHVTVPMTTEQTTPVVENTTTNETDFFDRNNAMAKVEIAILSTILYMALFGNGVVLLVLKLRYQQLSRMQWFIAHLAIADLFVGFCHVMPQLIWDVTNEFHGNDAMCRLMMLLQVVAMCASSFVLVMTAIDRYVSICHPLTSQTLSPSRVHQMIALAWTLSVIVSLPQVFIFRLTDMGDGHFQCYAFFVPGWGLKAYVTYTFLTIYVIPCLFLAFCYGSICLKVWESMAFKESSSSFRQSSKKKKRKSASHGGHKSFRFRVSFRRMHDASNGTSPNFQSDVDDQAQKMMTPPRKQPGKRQHTVSKAKVRTVKMTLTVVLTYLFCWAPYFLFNMISVFGEDINFEASYMVVIMLLASLNSCTNPWIYLAFSGGVCSKKKERKVSRSYNTSTQITYGVDTIDNTSTTAINISNINNTAAMLQSAQQSDLGGSGVGGKSHIKGQGCQGHSPVVLQDRRQFEKMDT